MRVHGLTLISLLISSAAAHEDSELLDCNTEDADVEKCAQKIDTVVAVTPGISYFTKIACKDCPYAKSFGGDLDDGHSEGKIAHGDQELFLNVTLANDTRSIFLNGKKIFPTLNTIPNPPHIAVASLHPDFSYKNLTTATSCSNPTCEGRHISDDCTEWCESLPLGRAFLDYSYAAHVQKEEPDAKIRFWEIVFDPVGGRSLPPAGHSGVSVPWEFDDPERKSLLIVVAGQPVKPGHKVKPHNSQDGGLFGSVGGADEVYELEITKVEQVVRRFNFAAPRLTVWGKIRRFFGADVWKEEGELVYLSDEWGVWGKKGTLRNLVGDVFHSNFVGLFFIIIGSVVGGFIALRIIQSLYLLVKQQSGLARWEGIDAVYSQLNQNRGAEEDEEGMFRGDYRDSYEEGGSRASMGWNEERMKPLPTKPLPEKPLPQEPLIDT
ncbi:uncharacterized protein EKO05_0007284 [Ascochyta rabiei]|uniref:Uncharacterized protein n=1 Tax=Didymella rabiei TaxID=5454 RepID=A0A163BVE7_DIDRA|nr:uncharacterized protein EKO05_0007284 [Ascochyta rabiei]KZM22027.1 hypothetical protein ST47_g6835 [Ascochyta rabiei]UPX16903.1 hypothetical protein EKO05_0007284 [Ascochyta rabiei]